MTGPALRVLIANDHLGSAGGMHGVARFLLRFIPTVDPDRVIFVPVILRPRDRFAEPFDKAGIHLRFLGRGKTDPRVLLDFIRIIRRERIDLLHVMGIQCDVIGRLAGLLTGVPVLVHGHDALDSRPGYVRAIDRWLGPRTKYGLAISAHVRRYMTEHRCIPKDHIKTLFLGLELNEFSHPSEAERSAFRAQLGVSNEELLAGSLGRLDRAKGLDILLDAAAVIVKECPRFRLMIAGEGREAARLKQQIAHLGLENHVRLVGLQDPRSFLSALDLYVMPSRSEGLGTAMIEAMTLGCCVVASRVGGIPEVVRDEYSGLLVPAENSQLLAKSCLRILHDTALRARLGDAAASFSQSRLSLATTVECIEQFYNEIHDRNFQ